MVATKGLGYVISAAELLAAASVEPCPSCKRPTKAVTYNTTTGKFTCTACTPEPTVVDRIAAAEAKKANGAWVPACGGTEEPFTTRTGRRLLYCFQPSTGKHGYLDLATDLILSDADAALALGK